MNPCAIVVGTAVAHVEASCANPGYQDTVFHGGQLDKPYSRRISLEQDQNIRKLKGYMGNADKLLT